MIKNHHEMVAHERGENYRKRELAILEPTNFLLIIIDGADHSAFGQPHLVTNPKDGRERSLKVKLVGMLQHGRPDKLLSLTMTKGHETGAIHIVEALHRYLKNRKIFWALPKRF